MGRPVRAHALALARHRGDVPHREGGGNWRWRVVKRPLSHGLVVVAVVVSTALPAAAQDAEPGGVAVAPAVSAIDDTVDGLPPAYTLRPGDELKVVVPYHPELTEELPVRPDGRLAFPIAGEVVAAGRTPEALAQELKGRLE